MSTELVENPNLQKPYGYIYKTTNLINGKIYIGQKAKNTFDKSYFGSGIYLKNALKKYGKENFSCFLLCWCWNQQELNKKEIEFIKYFKTIENGYNLMTGGNQGGQFCLKSKQKISKAKQNISQETRNKISVFNKGKTLSDSTKEKISIAKQGMKLSKEAKEKISKANRGKLRTDMEKEKMSLAKKGRVYKAQHNLNLSSSSNKQKIICLQTLTIYNSQKEAAKDLGLYTGDFNNYFKGKSKSLKGYTFSIYDPKIIYNKEALKKFQIRKTKIKEIYCETNKTKYSSILNLTKDLNIDLAQAYKVLKKEKPHAKGYTFRYI